MTNTKQPRDLSEKSHISVEIVNDIPNESVGPVIAEIELRSMEQLHVFLGENEAAELIKGFIIVLNPSITPLDSIVAQVVRVRSTKSNEIVLNIANYNDHIVNVEVRRRL